LEWVISRGKTGLAAIQLQVGDLHHVAGCPEGWKDQAVCGKCGQTI
jgi:hypothetical protein